MDATQNQPVTTLNEEEKAVEKKTTPEATSEVAK